MDKHAVALVLEEIALLLELHGANRFKAGAFRNAARAIERLDADVADLARDGALETMRGIGPATARVIGELAEHGRAALHEELMARTPAGMYGLLRIPGLGPSKIAALREHLGIESVGDLERAVASGAVASVPGFGDRTTARLASALAFVRAGSQRRRRPQALEAAGRVVSLLRAVPGVAAVEAAGELRRGCETVASLPVVVAAMDAACADVLAAFHALPGTPVTDSDGADTPTLPTQVQHRSALRFADGFLVSLCIVSPEAFGATLVEDTGSPLHVAALHRRARSGSMETQAGRSGTTPATGSRARSIRMERDDATSPYAAESAYYATFDLPWIPPELREGGAAEIDAAARGGLPRLVAESDLRGCLHVHTTYSDGVATLAELAAEAERRGWRYLGISDHSEAAAYAGGLTPHEVRLQHDEIDAWNDTNGDRLWIFKGIEADILPDGSLDFATRPALLERFDFVIGSVHGGFRSTRAEMTARVLRAIDDPHLTILGHPTGRLLLSRDAYEIDLERVIERAGQRGVAIEINADPRRLELDWRWWPQAAAHNVLCSINPDAHSVAGLGNVTHGVAIARKGWLKPEQVLTTLTVEALREHFAARRQAALM